MTASFAVAVAAAGWAAPREGSARAVSQDSRGVTIEFTPGESRFDSVSVGSAVYARVSTVGAVASAPVGHPALPLATLPVAVPEGMTPRVRIVSEDWDRVPGPAPIPVPRQRFVLDDAGSAASSEIKTEPDPAVYGRTGLYPAQAIELGRGAAVGEMWVVPVHVRPVRWDPGDRGYRVLRSMRIRVEFAPAGETERAARPSLRRGADSAPWRRIQERTVVNQRSAASFPVRSRAVPRPASRARLAANPEFKLTVTATGWLSVDYATLAAAGFPSGLAFSTLHLSERGYDDNADSATAARIAIVPRDGDGDGVFEAGDRITFYGRTLRDRVGAGSIENRYADGNVYWLTWGTTVYPPIDSISGSVADYPSPSPSTPTSFLDTIHLEEDHVLHASPDQGVAGPPEAADLLYWTEGSAPDDFQQDFTFVDPDVALPFRIRSYYQGRNNQIHRLRIYFDSASGGPVSTDTLALNATFFNTEVYQLNTGFTIPGSAIGTTVNRYRHEGEGQPISGGSFTPGSGARLNWIEVEYSRRYLARGNTLRFRSGDNGAVVELRVGGFTSPAIEIYDVTAPTAARRVTGVAVTQTSPGVYEALFRANESTGERRYVAVVPGAETALGSSAILADAPSDLTVPGAFPASGEARSIVIAPQAFLLPANRLADFRRSQGYVVEVANVQDVYDQFSGGVKSARAIRRYLRYAYRNWTPAPAYVLLAGDASLDYKHRLAESSIDWVPTYMSFEAISGPPGAEQVAQDSYYALNLNAPLPAESDYVPSLFLARIPASSSAELDQFVTKVIQYETFQPTDAWRGRMLLLSDDDYSTGLFSGASYCQNDAELLFKQTNVDFANTAAASQSGRDLTPIFFDLKTYSDPLAATCQSTPGCRNPGCVINAFRQPNSAVEQFHAQLTPGALFLNVQAHANRYLLAHEIIFCTDPSRCVSSNDYDLMSNVNRPVIFMVWGCHANQFPDGPFAGSFVDSLDAIGEQWLLLPNKGSIASVGSSGYEFLNTNDVYNLYVADALFSIPPAPPPPPGEPRRARWIVGEVLGTAAIRNGLNPFTVQAVMNRTVGLLGDPMLRVDALPPRVFEARLDGGLVTDGAAFSSDSPTDSLTLAASVRDEASIRTLGLAERDIASSGVAAYDSTLYSVAYSDTGRVATLTGRVRPRNANYDLQVNAVDGNGRGQTFTLQARVAVQYLANGAPIVNGVFVENAAVLRAEVTTPIPVTADSLSLLLDAVPIAVTKTASDGTGRRWVLESLPESRGPGTHVLQIAVGGRTAGFDQATYQVSAEFTMRGVAVVSPRMQGTGCGGSIFQYELSAPASKVELLLLTVSGRRVASLDLPGSAGLNVYCWDGRDSQGNDTATGLYFYRVRATDVTGKTAEQDGRMIRSR